MKTIPIREGEDTKINIPDHLVDVQPHFWREENFIEAFRANPDMTIHTFVESLPIDNYGADQVANVLLLDTFNIKEDVTEIDINLLWDAYRDVIKGLQIEHSKDTPETCPPPRELVSQLGVPIPSLQTCRIEEHGRDRMELPRGEVSKEQAEPTNRGGGSSKWDMER